MSSAAGKTISNLLEDALDLIGKGESPTENGGAQVTAAKQLLAERSKVRRGIDSSDFIAFNSTSKPAAPENPFLNQISGSSVDDPKYWKSGTSKKGPVKAAKSMKFTAGTTGQNKASKKRIAKGEQYNDKYLAKKESVSQKGQLRRVLKS
jgi:hypothetical protein